VIYHSPNGGFTEKYRKSPSKCMMSEKIPTAFVGIFSLSRIFMELA
jgi:hypothetical protein